MAFLMRKFIWSNHLGLLLRSMAKSVVCNSHCMAWNNPLEPDLGDLVSSFRSLIFVVLRRITRFSFAFIRKKCILLVVYVDDIVITGDNVQGISDLKSHLQQKFQTKDLEPLRYFLEIEIARSKKEISLSQWKYVLNMLPEACTLECKAANIPIDPNLKLLPDQRALEVPRRI